MKPVAPSCRWTLLKEFSLSFIVYMYIFRELYIPSSRIFLRSLRINLQLDRSLMTANPLVEAMIDTKQVLQDIDSKKNIMQAWKIHMILKKKRKRIIVSSLVILLINSRTYSQSLLSKRIPGKELRPTILSCSENQKRWNCT